MEYFTKQEEERFNGFWHLSGECKIWCGNLDKHGYGIFYFRKKNRKAHRVAYYFKNGSIPKEMVIDHICKNRSCIEITHLRLFTKKENILNNSNSVGAINAKKVVCKNGHIFDKLYGKIKKQRYCSLCENEKSKRLHKKWREEANKIKC